MSQDKPKFSREPDLHSDWPDRDAREEEALYTAFGKPASKGPTFRLPEAGKVPTSTVRWIAPGDPVTIAGHSIRGGLFYMGSPRRTPSGHLDGCVVNPLATVATAEGHPSDGPTGYWTEYPAFSPQHRSTYLAWLASDRRAPDIHAGFLRFYLHGIERRVHVDARDPAFDRAEYALLSLEVRRLLSLYGAALPANTAQLLDVIEVLATHPDPQYRSPPSVAPGKHDDLPLSIRVAFAQCAVDKAPVPAAWAHAWVLHDPLLPKRTPVMRCPAEFQRLFTSKYVERFSDGLKLPANKSRLKVRPHVSSPVLRETFLPTWIAALPDIAAMSGPRNTLREVMDACADDLDAYSRHLGRKPGGAGGTLDAALLLPVDLWPSDALTAMNRLRDDVAAAPRVMTYQRLLERFGTNAVLPKDRAAVFAETLSRHGIGIEPDPRFMAGTLRYGDGIGLYADRAATVSARTASASLPMLALMVDLAAAVAMADGAASPARVAEIHRLIHEVAPPTDARRARILTRASVRLTYGGSIAGLKSRLEAATGPEKHELAAHAVRVASADRGVSPKIVKVLEKLHGILGLDSRRLYSELHVGAAGRPASRVATPGAGAERAGFALDAERIARLKAESAAVSVILADVFAEEAVARAPDSVAPVPDAPSGGTETVLGLDQVHSIFLRRLLSRPSWSRAELIDMTSTLDLMVDGALEQVNEAALDRWDEPVTDGDDPVDINQDFSRRLAP